MLNNMDLRHNNRAHESKYYKKAVEEMDEGALENWYDELYQMILLAYLRMKQEDRAAKVKELKKIVPGTWYISCLFLIVLFLPNIVERINSIFMVDLLK